MQGITLRVLLVVTISCCSGLAADSNAEITGLIDPFFSKVGKGDAKGAVTGLFETNPYLSNDPEKSQPMELGMAGKITNLTNLAGNYDGYRVIGVKILAGKFAYVYCLANYDKFPFEFEFTFYKPQDHFFFQWMQFNKFEEPEKTKSFEISILRQSAVDISVGP